MRGRYTHLFTILCFHISDTSVKRGIISKNNSKSCCLILPECKPVDQLDIKWKIHVCLMYFWLISWWRSLVWPGVITDKGLLCVNEALSWNRGVVWDYQIISNQPSEWCEVSCSAAPCWAGTEHNECGGREPQQSRGRGCLRTRGLWAHSQTHIHTNTAAHLWLFKKAI